MVMLIVSLLFVSLSGVLAVRANARFRREDRIPMQWGVTGAVNWSAPRRLAFAFLPVTGALVLGAQTILSMTVAPRAGQEHLVLPVLIGSGLMLVAIQLLHIGLIARTLRRRVR